MGIIKTKECELEIMKDILGNLYLEYGNIKEVILLSQEIDEIILTIQKIDMMN